MRITEVDNPRKLIFEILNSLEKYSQFDSRSRGYIRISQISAQHALGLYRQTLIGTTARIEAEPPSATMVTSAMVSWRAEPARIGHKVRQTHIGTVRRELRDAVTAWFSAGKPFPSSGGVYSTVPNKSFERVEGLMDHEELRDAVRNLGLQDELILFFEKYMPLRYEVSQHLLQLVKSGTDPLALSRHNETAGTGLHIRGRRLKRADLASVIDELDFLLDYAYVMAASFAATQIAPLRPGNVWFIEAYDQRVRGALASRSDMEVLDSNWDGERLTINAVSQTRQAGADGTGTLSNSHTERQTMGTSVTEKVLRDYKDAKVEYPFTNRAMLAYMWSLDAKPFKGKQYVIGQDFGLSEPVKSPADALFSRAFMRIGAKVVPLMLSGSGWTQGVYAVFQNYYARRAGPDDRMLALGDDMNLITASATDDMFMPYRKVKSTIPETNTKKILGMFTKMSTDEDPSGEKPCIIGVVPRVIKTVSSAGKKGSAWADALSDLPMQGELELEVPKVTQDEITEDMEILKPYIFWSGKRRDLLPFLQSKWGMMDRKTWQILMRHNEDLQHRIGVDETELMLSE